MKLLFCLVLLPCIFAAQLSCPDGKTCPPGEACCTLNRSSFKCCNAGITKGSYSSAMVVSNHSGWIHNPKASFDANNGGCIEGLTCSGTCCPDEMCCPVQDATCCPTNYCCSQEHYCCPEKGCCPTGKECCGEYCCHSGNKCCGNNECCPVGSTCCPNGKGCCPNGYNCCGNNDKCCPFGYNCCPYKGCCPRETTCCGDKCCAHGKVCRGGDITGYCTDSSCYNSPSIILFSSTILMLFALKRYTF